VYGKQLTLARKRLANQNLWSSAFMPGPLWPGIPRDLTSVHRSDFEAMGFCCMTNEMTNSPIDDHFDVAENACDTACQQPDVIPGDPEAEILCDTTTSELTAEADSWRSEVAARLERYRTRRKPRLPRYPSLCLPFDAPESWSRPATTNNLSVATGSEEGAYPASTDSLAADAFGVVKSINREQYLEPFSKVIEFPRSAAIPVFHASELAEPVLDRPRIVEAPEILPPPPALGGMLIEPAVKDTRDWRGQIELAHASASIGWRILAMLVDGLVLTTAVTGFAAIFLRLNPIRELLQAAKLPLIAIAVVATLLFLWVVYEYLFVVYTGSTIGLRVARLQLAMFDGSPLARRIRKRRVIATYLSAFSVGLGYFWCVMDQDGLCWHDRITRTHLVKFMKPKPESPKTT
jgi:uncharacterized RDD family membrane protein YckC